MLHGDTPSSEAWLERLVGFDTTSDLSNLALIEAVADFLADHGIDVRLDHNEQGSKANLFCSIGGAEPGGVALSGHTDVVPVAGQDWTSDPFKMVERDGRLVGRGTADMKGFIACALAAVPAFANADLKMPLHLVLSYDEEVGCQGVGSMIDLLGRELPKPAIAIIGEPTEMTVVNAHKGIGSGITRITGKACHSSQPQEGVNAITAAGHLILELGRIQEDLKISALETSQGQSDEYEPPYTTVNPGKISGGRAVNIIPAEARLDWDCRVVPGDHVSRVAERLQAYAERELLPGMRERAPEADIRSSIKVDVAPLAPEPGSAAEELALHLTGLNRSRTVAYATEAGLFQNHGISAIVCGPGSINQAHRPDEFITRGQLRECEAFLAKLLDWMSR
ncbi:MAG: acetylornithine deacetylase [Magnetovibrionaceae bacterium]